MKKIMLSAIQPSGHPMLGNYLGAIKNWVELQKEYDCIFFVVDLHAITVRQDPKELQERCYTNFASYLAAGINQETACLFLQSHVPAHAELAWILNCFAYMGELNRMTQFKDKSQKQGKNIPAGLFNYPVLMAADILLYQTDLVPVGEDQKQHLELCRDIAQRVNSHYQKEVFKVPEPYIGKAGARIMDLQNPESKMSKSSEQGGTLSLLDSDSALTKKVKRAVTDSGTEITFSDDKPGIRNLLNIQSAITGKKPKELVQQYAGKQYGHLKVETAEIVVETIRPIREKIETYLADKGELDRILRKGAEIAAKKAEPTLKNLISTIGFLPRS